MLRFGGMVELQRKALQRAASAQRIFEWKLAVDAVKRQVRHRVLAAPKCINPRRVRIDNGVNG